MATLNTYVPLDFNNLSVWYGVVQSYSSTHITIAAGQLSATYRGSFTYDDYGNVFGQLTGFEQRSSGTLQVSVTGLYLDAYTAANQINSGNTLAFFTNAFAGRDAMYGSAYGDRLRGFTGNDTVNGNGGNDRLYGEDGADWLVGGSGADTLYGGSGADTLIGGSSPDDLFGGTGGDKFIFQSPAESRSGAGLDQIGDFVRGFDKIDLSAIDAKSGPVGNQAFSFIGSAAFSGVQGQLRYANGYVSGDVNGDRLADFTIQLTNYVASLSSTDFIL